MLEQVVQVANIVNGNPLLFLLVIPLALAAAKVVWDSLNQTKY